MQSTIKIHEYWCPQQKQDYEMIMQAVDDIGAASLTLATTGGSQAYINFIQTRDTFKDLYKEVSTRYRYIEQEKQALI